MSKNKYDPILPSLSCSIEDAYGAITEKFGRFCRHGLFQSDQFVQAFERRVVHIMKGLPELEQWTRIDMEKELATMLHDLQTNYGVIISQYAEHGYLRAIELSLDRAWVLQKFLDFARSKKDAIALNNEPLVEWFLEYLSLFIKNSPQDTAIYLEMLVRLSQVSEQWVDITLGHILEKTERLSWELIEREIYENNWYFWKETDSFDAIQASFMKDQKNPHDWRLGETTTLEYQEHIAKMHLFLDGIYQAYILPKIETIRTEELHRIHGIFNNLKDILDPDAYIPLYYYTRNNGEYLEVKRAKDEWRSIH